MTHDPQWGAMRRTIDMSEPRQHTVEEERAIREAALDRTIEGSFPASDPPSTDPNPYDRNAEGSEATTRCAAARYRPS